MPLTSAMEFAMRRYRSARAPVWALVSQAVTSGANFATTILLIRAIGLTDFGRYAIGFMIILIIRNFEIAAILTPLSSVGTKLRRTSQNAYFAFVLSNAVIFGLLTSCIAAAGV